MSKGEANEIDDVTLFDTFNKPGDSTLQFESTTGHLRATRIRNELIHEIPL